MEKRIHTLAGINVLKEQEAYEKLGFEIVKIDGNDNLVMAYLPNGWHKELVNKDTIKIYDDNGNYRCESKRYNFGKGMEVNTELKRKYDVHEYYRGALLQHTKFYFGEEPLDSFTPGKQLFVGGTAYDGIEYNQINEYASLYSEQCMRYTKECEAYGDKNYPNWRDYDAYWTTKNLKNDKPKKLAKTIK